MSRTAVSIAVRNVEKRYQPTRCYKFVLEVTWSDKSRFVVYRSYSEFLELHMDLIDAFPVEAGDVDPDQRVLPKLSGVSLFSRTEVQKVADKRRTEISDYCNRLMTLHPRISQYPKLLEFLTARNDDLDVPHDSKSLKDAEVVPRCLPLVSGFDVKREEVIDPLFHWQEVEKKKKKMRNSAEPEFEITNPLQLQTYRAITSYKAAGKGQISFEQGDLLDVIDKNANGWWYVSCSGLEGWAPATFLDNTKTDEKETDEIPCMAGELYLSIKEYTALYNDELSFGSFVVLEVMNKILDGWWIASYNGQVGYVPSTYLQVYDNPYLQPQRSTSLPTDLHGSPLLPTPRRQSIKNTAPPARDLQPYRRATEKRRQRTIRQKKPEEDDLNDLPLTLSIITEDEDYLTPQHNSNANSSLFSDDDASYVDPDAVESIRSQHASQTSKSSTSSSLSQLVAPPRNTTVSCASDSNTYEPVDTKEDTPTYQNDLFAKSNLSPQEVVPPKPIRTAGRDIPPPYLAPRIPSEACQSSTSHRTQFPSKISSNQNGKNKLAQKVTVPSSRSTQSVTDEYEVVCDTRTLSSPPPPPVAPTPAVRKSTSSSPPSSKKAGRQPVVAARVPPPKPSSDQLTTLSTADSDSYEYIDTSAPPHTAAPPTPPVITLTDPSLPVQPAPRRLAQPALRPSPSPKLINTKHSSPHPGNTKPRSPHPGNTKPSSSQPPSLPRSGAKMVTSPFLTQYTKPHSEKNNNESEDGKIYEELLVKPSQLKGKDNAHVRKPK